MLHDLPCQSTRHMLFYIKGILNAEHSILKNHCMLFIQYSNFNKTAQNIIKDIFRDYSVMSKVCNLSFVVQIQTT